ncbi:MAG TPA: PAS domain S-box protein, partial [Lacibacter sp.]|nr:PAS domain S-box protein [Lacibacter sp.]
MLVRPDGYYAGANPYYLNCFGLDEEKITTIHSLEIIHPDDHLAYSTALKTSVQKAGVAISVEIRKVTAEGNYISTKWEISYNGEENYIQCIGFETSQANGSPIDITSKEEMLEQLLSNSVDVFFLTDENNNVSYCSPNVTKVMGYEPSELLGLNGFSFVHPDDLELAVTTFKMEIDNPDQNNSIDLRLRKKDGSWLWTEAKGRSLFHNPHIRSMLINLNDISLRKQWEVTLKESENRYKLFFDHLPLPLFVISDDHKTILDVNHFAVEHYGYTKEEFLAISLCKIFDKPVKCEHLYDLYKSGQPVEHRTKNGDILSVTIARHEIIHSNINGYLLQINDITDSYRTNQENELGFDISEILIQPKPLNENLKLALNKLRSFTGWELAEIWVPGFDAVYLRNQVSDFDELDTELAAFSATTKDHVYLLSDYASSEVSVSQKPFWIEDIAASPFDFKRKEAAIKYGFQSALAIPVISEGTVVCCLFFLNRQQKKFNRNDVNLISIQGKLFGAEITKRKNNLMLDQFFL